LLLGWCGSGFAQGNTSATLEEFAKPEYRSATVGYALIDADTGDALEMSGAETSVLPASCMKLITTACAMHYLGPEFRFRTELRAAGVVRSGVLHGDLVIAGDGDPTFGSTRVEGSESSVTIFQDWVQAVRAAGVREVTGHVIGDASCVADEWVPGTWEWEDVGNYYGAAPAGLNFRDNFFDLVMQPGANIGEPAKIKGFEPNLPHAVEWRNEVVTSATGTGDQATVYSAPGSRNYRVAGTIPAGAAMHVKAAIHEPAVMVATLLQDKLRAAGVRVRGGAVQRVLASDSGTSRALATVVSPPLRDIVRVLNKQSFNLYAEALLLASGRASGGRTREQAIAAEELYLRQLGVPLYGLHIKDGSGLSRGDYVTALAMATLCQRVQKERWFEPWADSLPIMGVDGDLRDRSKESPLQGKVRAKTGLITRVRGLCGYVQAAGGRKLVFALHVNGFEKPWTEVDRDIDRVLERVVGGY
jgi:D-alanyl-D-alanine carboxypeptidase/D-alanyl-D-alanine-endopeptidase (penicillin-binding protein 4)